MRLAEQWRAGLIGAIAAVGAFSARVGAAAAPLATTASADAAPPVAPPLNVELLAIGVNHSFKGLRDLHFAAADAERFGAAMATVGLVPALRETVLTDVGVAGFRAAFDALTAAQRLDPPALRAGRKFFFYFSGHSDDRGLHLNDGLITKQVCMLAAG